MSDLLGPMYTYGTDYWILKYAKRWGLDIDLNNPEVLSEVNNGEEEKEEEED